MKRTAFIIGLLILAVATQLSAQVPTGTPAFGSFGGGPFDIVNLGNLNAHFEINVRSKAGRGMPFTYYITYDSSIYYPTTVNQQQVWRPTAGYGWNIPTAATGSLSSQVVATQQIPCNPPGDMRMITMIAYAFYVYTDPSGQTHPFDSSFGWYSDSSCASAYPSGSTNTATDGSGYVLTIANSGAATVTGPDGRIYLGGPSGTVTDSNGNQITTDSSGNFIDTLGQTALSITGTFPQYLKYTAPSGAQATWTINYTSYNIRTHFGCGIGDYSANNVQLPTSISLPDGSQYSFTYEDTAGSGYSGYKTGRLASVTLPTGGSIAYTYPTTVGGTYNGINCVDGSAPVANGGPSLTRTVTPGGAWTYYRTVISGNHWQTKVTSPPDPTVGNDTVIDFQQDATTGYGATRNLFETKRQIFQGSQSGGNVLSTIITCYNTANPSPTSCPATNVSTLISRMATFTYLPDASGKVSKTDIQYSQYSDPAFPSQIDSYDYGTTNGTIGPLLRRVINSWGQYGNAVKLSSTTVQDVNSNVVSFTSFWFDGSTPTVTTGTPQHTSVSGGRGNVTTIRKQITGGGSPTYLYRVFTYYDTGMLNSATDWGTTTSGGPNGTTYSYNNGSCGNSFPTSVSQPLSLSRSFTWDCNGGVMTTVTDENGKTSTTYYAQTSTYGSPDAKYWRPYATADELGYVATISFPSPTVSQTALLFNNNQSVVSKRTKLDQFGRLILSQMREGPTTSIYDSRETDYDALGRVSKTYIPFTNAADTLCSGTCPNTVTTYDALSRPLTVTDAGGGTITYTYTQNDVLQVVGPAPSGEHAKQRQLDYDGLGRLSWVCEITSVTGSGACGTGGGTGFWTKYTYDLLGNIVGVTQNAQAASGGQQTRAYSFDMLGRITSETNPENGTSATTYTYDSLNADASCGTVTSTGDVIKKTDAMGNVTCIKYDALHRVTATLYPTGIYKSPATTNKCFVYDTSTVNGNTMANAKTRLAEAYTTSSSSCDGTSKIVDEGFSYTARGEVSDVWQQTPNSGGWHHVNATYWAHGRLNVLNGGTNPLPGLPAITYGSSTGLDGKGRITKVTAASGQNPVSSVAWNAGNQVTGVTFGSLDGDTYQYDANTGRMTQYKFSFSTYSQTGALTWNQNGTLGQLKIVDTTTNQANNQTCTYGYDDLTRIISNSCGSSWAQTFGFDPFGNLSKLTGSATFLPTYTGTTGAPGTTPNNQYYQIPGGPSGTNNYYDGNGNLKSDLVSGTGHTYTWDADGNMTSVDGSTVTMIYDALDRMIEQTRGSSHTEIVYGPYGMKLALMNGQTLVKAFVKLPGGGRAVYDNTGLIYYRHADHLGHSRLATRPNRARYYQAAYAPYGEEYATAGPNPDLAFTDENQDTVAGGWTTNLYDFMLREYRTAHGRWTSPDPAGLSAVDPTNPQTWNRYAYVLNNPVALVDLLGDEGCYFGGSDAVYLKVGPALCGSLAGGSYWGGDGPPPTSNNGSYSYQNPGGPLGSGGGSVTVTLPAGCTQTGYTDENGHFVGDPMVCDSVTTLTVAQLPAIAAQMRQTLDYGNLTGWSWSSNPGDNAANMLAHALRATKIQAIANPCTYGAWYAGSLFAGGIGAAGTNSSVILESAVNNAPAFVNGTISRMLLNGARPGAGAIAATRFYAGQAWNAARRVCNSLE